MRRPGCVEVELLMLYCSMRLADGVKREKIVAVERKLAMAAEFSDSQSERRR